MSSIDSHLAGDIPADESGGLSVSYILVCGSPGTSVSAAMGCLQYGSVVKNEFRRGMAGATVTPVAKQPYLLV